MAQALLSYGADIKIKNIVLERFFSILPTIYMSGYRLIDPSDELVVDTFFKYTKKILQDRGEYKTIAQALISETFPDLPLQDLKTDELSLLAEVAIKRTVYKAIDKLYTRLYAPSEGFPPEILNTDPNSYKEKFIDIIIDKMFVMEKTEKISFLTPQGKVRVYEKDGQLVSPQVNWKFFFNAKKPYQEGALAGESKYEQPKFCFEPFLQANIKDAQDMLLCTGDITGTGNEPAVIGIANAIVKMFYFLGTGEEPVIKPAQKITDLSFFDNLTLISGKKIVVSSDDFNTYFSKIFILEVGQFIEGSLLADVMDALLKSFDVSVRCSADFVPPNSPGQVITPDQQVITPDQFATFFEKKTGRYTEASFNERPEGIELLFTKGHFHFVLAETTKPYKPRDFGIALDEIKKFNDLDLKKVFSYISVPMNVSVAEALMFDLLKTKEFDAIIKSVFNSALVFNTAAVAPNLITSADIIPLMRQRGVFSGLDEALNEMFSSLSSYLLGDFPWSGDCGDLARLL